MRRRFPWWLLLVAFVVVPLVEIYVIVQVGQAIGAWWTILLLVVDSVIGAWLVKREGGKAFRALRTALTEHRMPARELADAVLILVGGTLMVAPGFVTDVLGILLILPVTRPVGRRLLAAVITRRLTAAAVTTGPQTGPRTGPAPWTRQRPGPDDVVQGEVVDEG